MTPPRHHIIAAALALAATVSACHDGRHRDLPVPRRTAYSRLQLPPDSYHPVTIGGTTLDLNAAADTTGTVDNDGTAWLTAHYPDGMATLYITVNRADRDRLETMIDNRVERLSLNTGGAESQVSSFTTPAGLDARVIVTPRLTPTPVQFIVTDHASLLVSGTAHVRDAATAPADSLAPVIEMLKRDVTRLTTNLSAR